MKGVKVLISVSPPANGSNEPIETFTLSSDSVYVDKENLEVAKRMAELLPDTTKELENMFFSRFRDNGTYDDIGTLVYFVTDTEIDVYDVTVITTDERGTAVKQENLLISTDEVDSCNLSSIELLENFRRQIGKDIARAYEKELTERYKLGVMLKFADKLTDKLFELTDTIKTNLNTFVKEKEKVLVNSENVKENVEQLADELRNVAKSSVEFNKLILNFAEIVKQEFVKLMQKERERLLKEQEELRKRLEKLERENEKLKKRINELEERRSAFSVIRAKFTELLNYAREKFKKVTRFFRRDKDYGGPSL